ncbi:MAG TPA: PIN domain-containing protein [Fibrobacteres bacterium]|nr:PIN domain-containing protein [Fibrobacterota bacterium]
MRVYLDVCCLNRPFDNQQQPRIRLESEAVLLILRYCEQGIFEWLTSEIVDFEIEQIKDIIRKGRLQFILSFTTHKIEIKNSVHKRAEYFESLGIKGLDAYHLAVAEYGKADVYLTTDDKLLKRANYYKKELRLRVVNPLEWIREVENQ